VKKFADLVPIGREIRRLRKGRGLSQERLAELSELHRNYVGGIERAERNVGVIALLRIARALGVSPREFFDELP
jgi:transcriptional regulator with XRE-family HTH domain